MQLLGLGGLAACGDGGDPRCEPTSADVTGPFYESGAPSRTALASADEPGERLVIRGTVRGPDCASPLEGVLLDLWQADGGGNYHSADEDYRLRATLMTDAEPGIEMLTNSTGILAYNNIFTDLATIDAAIVADIMAAFENYYVEVGPESGALIGTPSVDD